MVQYNDHTGILYSLNFVGGAGQNVLPNTSNDQRAVIDLVSGIHQFNYFIINDLTDFYSLGYYDTPNDDFNNDGDYDSQYDYFSADNSAFTTQHSVQAAIINSVLSSSTYGGSFSDVANVNFNIGSGTASNADIVFGSMTTGGVMLSGAAALTELYVSNSREELLHGDIWVNDDISHYWDSSEKGSFGYNTIMHEIGHSLGLTGDENVPAGFDSEQYTIMSYNYTPGMDPAGPNNEVTAFGLQLMDIAAIQEIYGRNYDTRNTDTTYSKMTAFASTRPNNAFIYTIWDGNGVDKIDASGFTNPQGAVIDLRQGEFSSVGYNAEGGAAVNNLAIAYHAIIEDVTGTDNSDIIIGNAWNNALNGGVGDDYIFGDGASVALDSIVSQIKSSDDGYGIAEHEAQSGVAASIDNSGDDTLSGGAGNDNLYGGAGNDTYVYNLGDGHDKIIDSDQISLSFGAGITEENVNRNIVQNDLEYSFSDGGTLTIKDYLLGNGTILGIDYDGTGSNSRPSSGGTINGTVNADEIFGSDFQDTIYGSAGDDFIDAGGGADSVQGQDGNDIIFTGVGIGSGNYRGGNDNDILISNGGTSNDLFGDNGDDVLYAGHALDDLYGGNDNDTLYGSSSGGGDLFGEDGDDTLHGVKNAHLYGGTGTNYLYGGEDAGNFYFTDGTAHAYGSDARDNFYTYPGYQGAGTFGTNIIHDNGTNTNDFIYLDVRSDIYSDEIKIEQDNDDLLITGVGDESGTLRVVDHFTDTTPIDRIRTEKNIYLDIDDMSSWILGTDTSETLTGTSADEIIFSNGGSDILEGGDGNDSIYGGASGDIIKSGLGSDNLFGGSGDDTYFYQSGDDLDGDEIKDYAGNDTVEFGTDISFGNVSFSEDNLDLLIGVGSNSLTLHQQLSSNTSLFHIENLKLFNGYTFSLDNYQNWHSSVGSHTGTSDDEVIIGTGSGDTLSGAGGDDLLVGGEDNDTIDGGAGVDTADYSSSTSRVIVDLDGGTAADGFGATDTLTNIENVTGSAFGDNISGDVNDNDLIGDAGNDELLGGAGNDALLGGLGNDILNGEAGDDTLNGNEGDDFFRYVLSENSGNTDVYDGDSGSDRISFYFTSSEYTTDVENDVQNFLTFIDNNTDTASSTGMTYNFTEFGLSAADFEEVDVYVDGDLETSYFNVVQATGSSTNGTSDRDVITGLNGVNSVETIKGFEGDDYIDGRGGQDVIYGHQGNDEIYGGAGIDTIFGDGAWAATYGGNDTIYGGNGNDRVNGRAGDDIIHGGLGHDVLYGHEGEDVIYGDDGADTIFGDVNTGDGKDYNDILHGGNGSDTINGQGGHDAIYGEDGNDLLKGHEGMDYIEGGLGADNIQGGDDFDRLHGGEGNDKIYGGGDMDILRGESGFDKLFGEGGNDILFGDEGADQLNGGAGQDTFVFGEFNDYAGNAYNRIMDFNASEDAMNIEHILESNYDPLNDILSDFVQIVDDGTDTYLRIDENGTGTAYNSVVRMMGYTGHGDDAQDMVDNGYLII